MRLSIDAAAMAQGVKVFCPGSNGRATMKHGTSTRARAARTSHWHYGSGMNKQRQSNPTLKRAEKQKPAQARQEPTLKKREAVLAAN